MIKGISIMARLLNFVNFGDGKASEYDVARMIVKHYHDIPHLTIYELADLCFVSASTITRFVRKLGYSSYKEFKDEIASTIAIDVDYDKKVVHAKETDLQNIFQMYTQNVIENIRFTFENIDYEQLERIAKMLHEASSIAFFGLEYANYAGLHFQNKMSAFGRFVQIGTSDKKQLELSQSLTQDSLAIIVSLEGSFFYHHDDIMNVLAAKHCKIISLTMLNVGKVLQYSDEVVHINKTNNSTEGRITIMYFLELLIMNYYICYGNKIS